MPTKKIAGFSEKISVRLKFFQFGGKWELKNWQRDGEFFGLDLLAIDKRLRF